MSSFKQFQLAIFTPVLIGAIAISLLDSNPQLQQTLVYYWGVYAASVAVINVIMAYTLSVVGYAVRKIKSRRMRFGYAPLNQS